VSVHYRSPIGAYISLALFGLAVLYLYMRSDDCDADNGVLVASASGFTCVKPAEPERDTEEGSAR
jgi:hypothetical protein